MPSENCTISLFQVIGTVRPYVWNPSGPKSIRCCVTKLQEGENVHDKSTTLANRFILDLLEAHSNHNSTQAYFDTILEILRRRVCGLEVDDESISTDDEVALPHTYQACLRFFKDFLMKYNEIDVCQKCNFLFKDLLPEEAPTCPKCNHGRFKEPSMVDGKWEPGRAKCVFRWWPWTRILEALFMDPVQAQMARSWEKVDLDEPIVRSTGILGE